MRFIIIYLLLNFSLTGLSNNKSPVFFYESNSIHLFKKSSTYLDTLFSSKDKKGNKNFVKKIKLSIIIILLGPFGAHRIYLGTNYKVPLFYSLTIGGGFGILPLIDLFAIISSKDLKKFENNPKVFMWINNKR